MSKSNTDYDIGCKDEVIFFWQVTTDNNEVINEECLSQWWKSEFTDGNLTFCCAEQYMMYKKAELFLDYHSMREILNCKDPKTIKKLGRRIKNFNQVEWDKNKISIIIQGNLYKFTQNENLKEYLLSTKDSILVEASPYDTVWGIGLNVNDKNIKNPDKWRGENLLGLSLMKVREIIKDNICYVTPLDEEKLKREMDDIILNNIEALRELAK